MKLILSTILFTFIALVSPSSANDEVKPLWNLEIVPTRSPLKDVSIIDCASLSADQSGFSVVLRNVSDRRLAVWREWCSWGYECLSFEITLPDGRVFTVRKMPREYWKNYPDPYLVAPNKSFIINVKFDDEKWQGFPKDWKNQEIKIEAIYRIKEDDQTKRLDVWHGQVRSVKTRVKLYR